MMNAIVRMYLPILIVIMAALPGLVRPAPAGAAPWKGSEVTEDGVRHVRNPEAAMDITAVELREAWHRGDEDDDIFFGLPSAVIEDANGDVYILDSQVSEVLVFTSDGEYLRTIGREGDGPGEFRDANDMYFGPEGAIGVVRIFPGKIVRLRKDGTPENEFPLPRESAEGFQLVFKARAAGDRVVIAGAKQGTTGNTSEQRNYLKAFATDGSEIAHYAELTEHTQYGGMQFDEKVFANFKGQWALSSDGRVAAVLSFDDYRVHVWNPDGTLQYVIERPGYVPLARTGKEKETFQKLYDGVTSWNPGSSFKVSDTHRAIVQVYFRPDGALWVLSGRGVWSRDEGVFAVFDEYDRDGKFTRQVTLRGPGSPEKDGVFLGGDRLYRVSDSLSAFMAQYGGETAGDDNMEPLQVFALEIDSSDLGRN